MMWHFENGLVICCRLRYLSQDLIFFFNYSNTKKGDTGVCASIKMATLSSYAQCRVIIGCPKTEAIMQWVGLRRLLASPARGPLGQDTDEQVKQFALAELTLLQRVLSSTSRPRNFRAVPEFANMPQSVPAGVAEEMNTLWNKFLSDPAEHLVKLRGLITDGLFLENYPYTFNIMRTAYSQFESIQQHAAKRNRFTRLRNLREEAEVLGQTQPPHTPLATPTTPPAPTPATPPRPMWPMFSLQGEHIDELSYFLEQFLGKQIDWCSSLTNAHVANR